MVDLRTEVRLHRYRERPFGLRWRSGRRSGELSSGTTDRREAERAALRLEDRLLAGYIPGAKDDEQIEWAAFRRRYEEEWLYSMSFGSRQGWRTAANHFERICAPILLADVDKAMLSKFRAGLEAARMSATSAKSYYGALHAGLGWAVSEDLLEYVPKARRRRQKQAVVTLRSRPVTGEEFDRIVSVVPKVRRRDPETFQRFLKGLWYSSLGLDELARLSWDARDPLHVSIDDPKLPVIVFLGAQKNGSDGLIPAPSEFWEVVEERGHSRTDRVFAVANKYGTQMTTRNIGRRISEFGRAAGVVVDPATGKCATAHDLRLSALTAVAAKGTMSQTQAVARHESPQTTSNFYVQHQVEELAKSLGWYDPKQVQIRCKGDDSDSLEST